MSGKMPVWKERTVARTCNTNSVTKREIHKSFLSYPCTACLFSLIHYVVVLFGAISQPIHPWCWICSMVVWDACNCRL